MTLLLQAETQDKLRRICPTLHAEFPELSSEDVVLEVEATTRALLETARIDSFVPVLVHRFAREHILDRGASSVRSGDWMGRPDTSLSA